MIFNKNGGKLVADITTISHGWRIVNGERKVHISISCIYLSPVGKSFIIMIHITKNEWCTLEDLLQTRSSRSKKRLLE